MSRGMSRRVTRAVVFAVIGGSMVVAQAQTPAVSPGAPSPSAKIVQAVGQLPVLSEQVPAGVLVFSSWAGRSNVPKEFADTHFSLLLTALNLPAWADDKIPEMLPPEAAGNPAFDSLYDLAKTIVNYAWENTSAVYSLGPGMNEQLQPEPQICFIIRFDDDRAADAAERDIQDRITAIAGGEAIPNIRLFRKDNTLAFTANDAVEKSPLDPIEAPLSTNERFANSVKRNAGTAAGGAGGVNLYLNLERAWSLSDENNAEDPEYQRNMLITGAKHAKAILLTAGQDGKDWGSRVFVTLDPKRSGLLGAMTVNRPVDSAIYRGVPKSATSVSVVSLDFADVISRVKSEGEQVKKGFSQQADAWIGLIGGLLSVNVAELTGNFGTDLALYALPSTSGTSFDFVLLTKPKDTAKVDQQLWGLSQGVQRLLMTQRPDVPRLNLQRGEVTSVEMPDPSGKGSILAPAWASKDGYLLLAANKDIVTRAISEMGKGVLADSGDFSAAKARLGAPAGASFGYSDLAKTLSPMYAEWTYTFAQAGSGIHPNLKKLPIPTEAQLSPHSAPIVSATWVDDDGLHYRSIAPYPAAEMFSSTLALVAGRNSLPAVLPALGLKLAPKPPSN